MVYWMFSFKDCIIRNPIKEGVGHMFLIAIGSCVDTKLIKADIYRNFNEAIKNGIDIVYEDYYIGDMLFISCGIKDTIIPKINEKKSYEEFKYILSEVLADVIIGYYELRFLKKIIKENFFYLNESEQCSVMENARKLLKGDSFVKPGGFYSASRKSRIMRNILEYLNSENEINVEGFIQFRMNAYINNLNATAERALEIFVAEKEYNEFIKLLRYFVDIQECKIDTVHLYQSEDGRYLLYDERNNRISSEYFDELRAEILDETINYDDLLISTLITISPNKIMIHDPEGFKNRELLQTIMNVFEEKISTLKSCDLCSDSNDSNESNKYSL